MDNYLIFSAARTGSSYLTSAVTKQIRCLEPNTFYGGELWNWSEYFKLSQPGTVGPGGFDSLEKDPGKLNSYDSSQPQGDNPHIYLGEGGIIHRNVRATNWNEVAPVSFRRAREESQRRLTMLENSYFPWVIKIHPDHLDCLDIPRFNRLVERGNTRVVLLYRSHLWDWFLSWVAVRSTGLYQHTHKGEEWERPEVKPQQLSPTFLHTWYANACSFINMSLNYRAQADHVVAYESFSGDPRRDAGCITGLDLFPETPHQVKLWSQKDKENMIANLNEVKELFRDYCKLLGYSGGRLYL